MIQLSVPALIAEYAVWTSTSPGRSSGSGTSRRIARPWCAKTRFMGPLVARTGGGEGRPAARLLWRRGGGSVTDFGRFDAYVADHAARFFDELIAYGRQPSVSATGEGIAAMAPLVVATLERVGAAASIVESPARHAAVIGEVGSGRRGRCCSTTTTTCSRRAIRPRGRRRRGSRRCATVRCTAAGSPTTRPSCWRASTPSRPGRRRAGRCRFASAGSSRASTRSGRPASPPCCARTPTASRADVCLSEGTGRDEVGNVTINLGCRGFVSVELAVRLRPIPLASSLGGPAAVGERPADASACCRSPGPTAPAGRRRRRARPAALGGRRGDAARDPLVRGIGARRTRHRRADPGPRRASTCSGTTCWSRSSRSVR